MLEPSPARAPVGSPDSWLPPLFDRSPTPMAIMRPGARFHHVNPAMCRFLGRPGEAFATLRVEEITHPEDLPGCASSLDALQDGTFDLEKRYLRPDGTVVWGHVTGSGWRAPDGELWFLLVIEDVTARKRAEARLGEREQEFAVLFEEAPFGMAVNAPDGRFLNVNRAFADLVGYTPDELLAMEWLDLVHPLDRDASAANYNRERAGESWERDVVRRISKRDGHTAWLRCKGQIVRAPDGTPRYCVGQFVDLTPARQQEEERRMLEEHLRRSQRTETIGRLAGGIVHDFNNMLSVILNVAELARLRLTEPPGREYAEQIHSAAARAAALSRRLMAVGRADAGVPENLDLNSVVTEIRPLLQRVAGEDVRFVTDLTTDLHPIRSVRPHLEQALFNLVVNARDAMPIGGKLTVRTRNVADADVPGAVGPFVLLEVEDTGSGIPADVVPHLFEPFFTTKESGKGTGLGLSIVQHVVADAGGTVTLRTRPGAGTVFSVLLPAATEAASTGDVAEAPTALRGNGERVLVVEDEVPLLDLVVQVLSEHGYVPLAAPGAEEAQELARHVKGIDLLLTDVVMPGMSGSQLAAAVRALHPDVRVLMMSGHPDDRVARHAAPNHPIVRKPFAAKDLLSGIRAVLDARRSP